MERCDKLLVDHQQMLLVAVCWQEMTSLGGREDKQDTVQDPTQQRVLWHQFRPNGVKNSTGMSAEIFVFVGVLARRTFYSLLHPVSWMIIFWQA